MLVCLSRQHLGLRHIFKAKSISPAASIFSVKATCMCACMRARIEHHHGGQADGLFFSKKISPCYQICRPTRLFLCMLHEAVLKPMQDFRNLPVKLILQCTSLTAACLLAGCHWVSLGLSLSCQGRCWTGGPQRTVAALPKPGRRSALWYPPDKVGQAAPLHCQAPTCCTPGAVTCSKDLPMPICRCSSCAIWNG